MTGCDDSSKACVRMIATMVVRVAGNSIFGIRIKQIPFAFYLYVQAYNAYKRINVHTNGTRTQPL